MDLCRSGTVSKRAGLGTAHGGSQVKVKGKETPPEFIPTMSETNSGSEKNVSV